MDNTKCQALKAAPSLRSQSRASWSVERFFDGNDDSSSIGWNLPEHPGMDVFRDLLTGLLRRSDVQAVYAKVIELELDLGEDCWPATDIIFVVGTISPDELRSILSPLEPDEVSARLISPFQKLESSRNTRHPLWLRGGVNHAVANSLTK